MRYTNNAIKYLCINEMIDNLQKENRLKKIISCILEKNTCISVKYMLICIKGRICLYCTVFVDVGKIY